MDMPRKKNAQSQPPSAVFNSVIRILASLDQTKPSVMDVTKKGSRAVHELLELDVNIKRTMKKAPIRVASTIFGFATKSSLNVVQK